MQSEGDILKTKIELRNLLNERVECRDYIGRIMQTIENATERLKSEQDNLRDLEDKISDLRKRISNELTIEISKHDPHEISITRSILKKIK